MAFVNDQPLEHTSRNGTRFVADRCDLKNGVKVVRPSYGVSELGLCDDFAQFAAWHRSSIFGQLSYFPGYDAISYEFDDHVSCVESGLGNTGKDVEPTVEFATVRSAIDDGEEELDIECRMSDGQKGAFVVVDSRFPELAQRIADSLSNHGKGD